MDLNRTKRIIYVSLGVITLGVIIFLLVRSFLSTETRTKEEQQRVTGRAPGRQPSGDTGVEKLTETPKELEIVGRPEQKLVRLSDFPTIGPALNKGQNKILFYKKDGGGLYQTAFSGENQEKISNLTIVGLTEALWNQGGERAAVFYLDGETKKSFLHIGTTTTAALPQDLTGFSWSPDGRSLAYLQKNADRLNLVTADSSGRGAKTIYTTPIMDSQVSWVNFDKLAFETAPSGLAEGFIFTYSRSANSFVRLLGPFFGLTSLMSPDGSRVLVSTTDTAGRNLDLTVYNASGKAELVLTPPTLPEKCVWLGSKIIYCAVSRSSLADSILPDEYLRGELNTSDRIIRLDLENKKTQEVFNQEDFDISNLIVTKDESYLFFINRKDGTLWSLKLK
jgi:hypothetical protein